MRFHQLQITNLNSLYGSVEEDSVKALKVDFDGLGKAPVFLIMGPTGAGKSSILDAICLALFGETPRQRETGKRVAERIMSHDTGELAVTLEFSRRDLTTGGRLRYRATWQCQRAHRKANGNMQAPRRSLYRQSQDGTWEALQVEEIAQKRYEEDFRDALEGMTIDDFLRCVLLAQGEFTAFLEADSAVKADILEKLTGTEEYLAIGRRASARYAEVQEELRDAERRIEALELMSDEALQEHRDDLEAREDQRAQVAASLEEVQTILNWLKRSEELAGALRDAETAHGEVEREWEERREERERWTVLRRARSPLETLRRRDEAHREMTTRSAELTAAEDLASRLDTARADAAEDLVNAERLVKETEAAQKELAPQIREARKLRTQHEELQKRVKECRQRVTSLHDRIAADEKQLQGLMDAQKLRQKELAEIDVGEDTEEAAARLRARREELRGVPQRLDRIDEGTRKREELSARREALTAELNALEERRPDLEELRDLSEENVRLATDRLGLTAYRENLRDGEPCPLCGSTDHPLAGHRDGGSDALQRDLDQAREKRATIETRLQRLQDQLREKDKTLGAVTGALQRYEEELREAHQELAKVPGLPEITAENGPEIRRQVVAEAEAIENSLKELQRLRRLLQDQELSSQRIEDLNQRLTERRQEHSQEEAARDTAVEAEEALRARVKESLNGGSPDDVEKSLQDRVDQARSAQKKASEAKKTIEVKSAKTTQAITSVKTRIDELTKTIQGLSDRLQRELSDAEIDGEERLRELALPDDEFRALEEAMETLRERRTRAITTLENAGKHRDAHHKAAPKGLPESPDRQVLTERRDTLQASVRDLDRRIGGLRETIKAEERQRHRREKMLTAYQEVAARERVWKTVYDLIGVNKGERFKHAAQALNLQRIAELANGHLQRLRQRFQLSVALDKGFPTLDFEVIDTYHSYQRRPVSTLSGGESFLVSLSLALALADRRNLKMPVETLLLDEGFGTLDQDALQVAVSVLKDLGGRSRQVGVISHVEALQEEIEHRFVVEEQGAGRSTIRYEGPYSGLEN